MNTIADTAEGVLELLADKPFDFAPGAEWRYNQTNYMLLAMLIEKLTGLSYETFVKSKLFTPLGVHSPEFGSHRLSTSNSTSTYTVFYFGGSRPLVMGRVEPLFEKMSPVILPAGGLNISVADFAVWLSALLDERIISMASLNEIWIPTKLNDGTIFKLQRLSGSPQWSAYGLGW